MEKDNTVRIITQLTQQNLEIAFVEINRTDVYKIAILKRNNCYDNFELTKCDIINESYEGEGTNETALVKFVAKLVQVDSREKTSFMETSTFERAGKSIRNGAWLYKSGKVYICEILISQDLYYFLLLHFL